MDVLAISVESIWVGILGFVLGIFITGCFLASSYLATRITVDGSLENLLIRLLCFIPIFLFAKYIGANWGEQIRLAILWFLFPLFFGLFSAWFIPFLYLIVRNAISTYRSKIH